MQTIIQKSKLNFRPFAKFSFLSPLSKNIRKWNENFSDIKFYLQNCKLFFPLFFLKFGLGLEIHGNFKRQCSVTFLSNSMIIQILRIILSFLEHEDFTVLQIKLEIRVSRISCLIWKDAKCLYLKSFDT